jgi:hypothetical protein
MSALPEHPTERDRERFRDLTKAMQFGLEYDRRLASNGDYTDPQTVAMFRLWWSVERERQLLQNLNQSQGVKLSELLARAEKAEEALRSLASFVGAGGYNADKVDAGVFEEKIRWGIGEIMKRAGAAEAELAKLRGLKVWNPLEDDGDALRLAVKLGMDIRIYGTDVRVACCGVIAMEGPPDLYAATRRAITRAAAEIGRNMP